jgi:hypothetical protein
MKSGYKTTEFWLILAAIVVAQLQIYISDGITLEESLLMISAILAALGYTAGRSYIKKDRIVVDQFDLTKFGTRYILACPKCGQKGLLDNDQFHGRVSVMCPNDECDYHETHDFSKVVEND